MHDATSLGRGGGTEGTSHYVEPIHFLSIASSVEPRPKTRATSERGTGRKRVYNV